MGRVKPGFRRSTRAGRRVKEIGPGPGRFEEKVVVLGEHARRRVLYDRVSKPPHVPYLHRHQSIPHVIFRMAGSVFTYSPAICTYFFPRDTRAEKNSSASMESKSLLGLLYVT